MFLDDDSLAGHDHLAYRTHEVPSFDSFVSDPAAGGAESWRQQTTDFTCAIVSQQMILEQFGVDLSEAQLVYEATSAGFLTSAGTMPEDMGRLLEAHGVSTHQSFGLENLSNGTGVFLLNFRNFDRGSRSGSFVYPAGLSIGIYTSHGA